MKLYAPKYYKNFRCVADKCDHNCCIGWEIDVDEGTLEKYESLKGGYGEVIKDSISDSAAPHFKLCEGDMCPHLDQNGLCRIIINFGEDHLCDICRQHPRFYNYTSVAEVGVGMSCREAARLILSSPDYSESEAIGEVDVDEDEVGFDGREDRSRIYGILKNGAGDYSARLRRIYEAYSLSAGEDSVWLDILGSMEYLDDAHKSLFASYSSSLRPQDKDEYLERFLAYFLYRHLAEAEDEDDLVCRLSFCLFCERLFASLICSEKADSLDDLAILASIISEEIEYSDDNTLALTY